MIQRPSMSFRLIEADGIDARPPETVEEIGRGSTGPTPRASPCWPYEGLRPAEAWALEWRDVLVTSTKARDRIRVQRGLTDHEISPTKSARRAPPGEGPLLLSADHARRSLDRKTQHPRRLPRTPSLPARAARCGRSRHARTEDGGYGGAGRTGSGAADPLAVPLFEASRLTLAGPSSSCFAVTRPTDDATVHKRGRADTGVLPPPFTLPSLLRARCSRRRRCCRHRGRVRR